MKYKKYQIRFKKKYIPVGHGTWKSIKDDEIIVVLMDLKKEIDFEIRKIHIQDCFSDSWIVIKCKKENWLDIYANFFRLLSGYVTNADFKY